MGFFDKIRGQSPKVDKTPPWMNPFLDQWEELDRATAEWTGSDADRVRATVMPMLVDDVEVLKKNFVAFASGFVAIGLMPVIGGKRDALGTTWCERCQHPTMTIAPPSAIQRQTCSVCGREDEIQFLRYSPAVGRQVRELFAKQAAYIDLIDGGKELARNGKSDLAELLYSEARAAAKAAQNVRAEAGALSAMADLKFALQAFDAALALDTESQRLYRKAGDRLGFMFAMQKRALNFWARSEAERACVLFERVEDMCRARANDPNHMLRLATVLGGKARVFLMRMSTLDRARQAAEESRTVARNLNRLLAAKGSPPVLAENDNVEAVEAFFKRLGGDPRELVRQFRELLFDKRDLTMERLRRLETLCRSIGDLLALNRCLNVQLEYCWTPRNQGDKTAAIARVVELPRIFDALEEVTRKRGDHKALAAALQARVQILTAMQDDGVRTKTKEAEVAARAVEAADREIAALERQELAAEKPADWPHLRELVLRHMALLRSHGRDGETVPVLSRLADAERQLGDLDAVSDAYEQIEAVGHAWSDRGLIADAQTAEGQVLEEVGHWDGALGRYQRAALWHDEIVGQGNPSPALLAKRRDAFLRVRQIGDRQARKGDWPSAIHAFRVAISTGESMLKHPPVDHELRFHHLAAVDELGVTLLKGDSKQRDEGSALVRQAMASLEQLDRDDPAHRMDRDKARQEIRSHFRI